MPIENPCDRFFLSYCARFRCGLAPGSDEFRKTVTWIAQAELMLAQAQEADLPIQQLSFFIEDQVNTTVAEIMAKAMQHQLEYGLDVLIIDYLQLIGRSHHSSKNSSRVDQFSEISRELKAMARTLQVPVIVGSQLSRAGETRTDKRPQMSDIRESGAIEQDADNILMLYRDDYYYEDSDTPGITTVYVRKNRQGAVGAADLMFQRETTTFLPVDKRSGKWE